MTRITNADHVLLLLRNHLERTQKERRKRAKAETSGQKPASQPGALQRVEHLASVDGLSDLEVKKALIAGILADEFGNQVTNDPQFVQVVDDVVKIIERDEDASALLRRAFQQIASHGAD